MSGFLLHVMIGLLALIGMGTALFAISRTRRYAGWLSLIAGGLAVAGSTWIATRPAPVVSLKITSPSNGASVGMRVVVRGEVASPDLPVWIAVHPLATELWWVQAPAIVQSDATWQAHVTLGTTAAGQGEGFELVALTSKEGSLIRKLRGADLAAAAELNALPPYYSKSNIVLVNRLEDE